MADPRTSNEDLASAVRILAGRCEDEEGVVSAALQEAAQRIEEHRRLCEKIAEAGRALTNYEHALRAGRGNEGQYFTRFRLAFTEIEKAAAAP